MKKRNQKNLSITISLLISFILWTVSVNCFDVQAIGPRESSDWLGLVPLCFVLGFGVLGLVQLIKKRSLLKVDSDILLLGGFYVLVMFAYVMFEVVVINYRPVLIEGYLEASYPSSTTMLVMCVMPTAVMQFHNRIKEKRARKGINYFMIAFTVCMVIGRLVSGVHWVSDIVGGALLSAGLVMLYYTLNSWSQTN